MNALKELSPALKMLIVSTHKGVTFVNVKMDSKWWMKLVLVSYMSVYINL